LLSYQNLKPEDEDHLYVPPPLKEFGNIELRILLGRFSDEPVDFVEPSTSSWAMPIYGKEKFESSNPGYSLFVG